MDNFKKDSLASLVLAPWIQKATFLIQKGRRVGGNMFRHQMASMTILIDYDYILPKVLKAALVHDLIEEIPAIVRASEKERNPEISEDETIWFINETISRTKQELKEIDSDGAEVLELVMELTKQDYETKLEYLRRIKERGSFEARIIKCADRISNLIERNYGEFTEEQIRSYMIQTIEYVLPVAMAECPFMAVEIRDLCLKKTSFLNCRSEIKEKLEEMGFYNFDNDSTA